VFNFEETWTEHSNGECGAADDFSDDAGVVVGEGELETGKAWCGGGCEGSGQCLEQRPQRLKRSSSAAVYRSAEALRHPKNQPEMAPGIHPKMATAEIQIPRASSPSAADGSE